MKRKESDLTDYKRLKLGRLLIIKRLKKGNRSIIARGGFIRLLAVSKKTK